MLADDWVIGALAQLRICWPGLDETNRTGRGQGQRSRCRTEFSRVVIIIRIINQVDFTYNQSRLGCRCECAVWCLLVTLPGRGFTGRDFISRTPHCLRSASCHPLFFFSAIYYPPAKLHLGLGIRSSGTYAWPLECHSQTRRESKRRLYRALCFVVLWLEW